MQTNHSPRHSRHDVTCGQVFFGGARQATYQPRRALHQWSSYSVAAMQKHKPGYKVLIANLRIHLDILRQSDVDNPAA